MELQPGEKAAMSLTLPKGLIIAFDPVTHSTLFLDVSGEEIRSRAAIQDHQSDDPFHRS
jgi:Family of unknown function (DUF5939)